MGQREKLSTPGLLRNPRNPQGSNMMGGCLATSGEPTDTHGPHFRVPVRQSNMQCRGRAHT